MTGLLAPGLYRQLLDPVRPDPVLVRGDIAALLGYALRGPAGAPVRVSSLREFEDVYGSAPTSGYLWHAVKGFFETGGRSAYVVRIVTDRARAARNDGAGLELIWRATASFPWTMIDPRRPAGAGPSGSEGWEQVFERQLLESGPRSDDPGGWGNGLSLRVRRTSVVRTATLPEVVAGGTASRFGSLAGVHPTSVLELSQTVDESPPRRAGRTVMVRLLPLAVDTDRRLVHWGTDLAALQLDPRRPIRVASVEFDIDVHREGRLEQSFTGLAPHPGHPASISAVMAPGCRSVELRPVTRRRLEGGWQDEDPVSAAEVLAGLDWADHGNWPQEGDFALSGGADGLEDMSAGPWLDGLRAVGRLPDAALIAVPDLVLVAEAPPQVKAGSPDPVDCSNLFPAPPGQLTARVTGTDPEGATVPVPGALVDVAGPGGSAVTGADGTFSLAGIPVGLVTLRIRATGYEPLEFLVQSSPFHPPEVDGQSVLVQIPLVRITTPRALVEDEILLVQQAMTDQSVVGPYRVAVLDPPGPDVRIDEIASWRSRLGDDARMGLFTPWLRVPVTAGLLDCPPSGHVCGAFALAENTVGIHRTGANLPLRYVEGTTQPIDDGEQAYLNPAGINAIRAFPGRGVRVFGSRTLSSATQWRFLTARRVVDAIEQTLERALQWMIFEPNSQITRHAVALTAGALLGRMYRDGVLAGSSPEAAFSVKCDLQNNPDESRATGQLVVDIGVAPTLPYEFVLFRLGHAYDALSVTESAR